MNFVDDVSGELLVPIFVNAHSSTKGTPLRTQPPPRMIAGITPSRAFD